MYSLLIGKIALSEDSPHLIKHKYFLHDGDVTLKDFPYLWTAQGGVKGVLDAYMCNLTETRLL